VPTHDVLSGVCKASLFKPGEVGIIPWHETVQKFGEAKGHSSSSLNALSMDPTSNQGIPSSGGER